MQVVPSFTFSLLRGSPGWHHQVPPLPVLMLLRAQGPGTAWDSVCPVVTPGTIDPWWCAQSLESQNQI